MFLLPNRKHFPHRKHTTCGWKHDIPRHLKLGPPYLIIIKIKLPLGQTDKVRPVFHLRKYNVQKPHVVNAWKSILACKENMLAV